MVAAKQLGPTEFHRVVAADQSEIVTYFIPADDGEIWQEDVRSEIIHKSGDLKSRLPGLVRNHVQGGVIELQEGFVLGRGAELMVPSSEGVVVIVVDRTSGRKPRERLHVRVLLEIVPKSVGKSDLVRVAESMVEPAGHQVLPGVVIEQSTVCFQRVYKKAVQRRLPCGKARGLADGQAAVECARAEGCGNLWHVCEASNERCDRFGCQPIDN